MILTKNVQCLLFACMLLVHITSSCQPSARSFEFEGIRLGMKEELAKTKLGAQLTDCTNPPELDIVPKVPSILPQSGQPESAPVVGIVGVPKRMPQGWTCYNLERNEVHDGLLVYCKHGVVRELIVFPPSGMTISASKLEKRFGPASGRTLSRGYFWGEAEFPAAGKFLAGKEAYLYRAKGAVLIADPTFPMLNLRDHGPVWGEHDLLVHLYDESDR